MKKVTLDITLEDAKISFDFNKEGLTRKEELGVIAALNTVAGTLAGDINPSKEEWELVMRFSIEMKKVGLAVRDSDR